MNVFDSLIGQEHAVEEMKHAATDAAKVAYDAGMRHAIVYVKGPGSGRDTAVKSVGAISGIRVTWLKDVTPLAHNGCRPPKRRRV